jgi:hypothetical protein
MRKSLLRGPSPAGVLAFVALIVALGGTSYAAFSLPKNSVGTKQLKNGAVTTTKIKNGSVTKSKINASGLTVPNAQHASSAGTATLASSAGTATHASSADTATHADTASNSTQLGGRTAASFEGSVEWALVASDGTVVQQSGGITAVENAVAGAYRVTFPDDISRKGLSVSPSYKDAVTSFSAAVAPCTGPGQVIGNVCTQSQGNGDVAGVVTNNPSISSAPASHAFYVLAMP